MRKILFSLLLVVCPLAEAQLTVGGGRGGGVCGSLAVTIVSHWASIKNHMVPLGGKLEERIKSDMFVCISRYEMRQAHERRVSASGNFRFFTIPFYKGFGVTCDDKLYSCAILNPGLFPELIDDSKDDAPEVPESDWVRPPSDNEQWKSNK